VGGLRGLGLFGPPCCARVTNLPPPPRAAAPRHHRPPRRGQVNEPTLTLQVDDDGLQAVRVQEGGVILATGSVDGSVYLMELCNSLAVQQPQEKQSMQQMLDREFKKEKNLEARAKELAKKARATPRRLLAPRTATLAWAGGYAPVPRNVRHSLTWTSSEPPSDPDPAPARPRRAQAAKESEAQRDPTALQPTDEALKAVEQEFYDTIAEYEQKELEANRKD